MKHPNDYIAVFDSGVGGVSVLRQLMRIMPKENYLYFGDCANAPYGSRTTAEVRQLTLAAAEKLITNYPVKALVVACNTATAAAIDILRETYPDHIIIGIEPALKMGADRFPRGRIGVMATQVTLREEKFLHQTERFPNVQVQQIPAPGLVELIESGRSEAPETRIFLEKLLLPYKGQLDALVLGCTHYPFVRSLVAEILGAETQILDGGEGTARQTKRCLEAASLLHDGPGSIEIKNSSADSRMVALARQLLEQGGL